MAATCLVYTMLSATPAIAQLRQQFMQSTDGWTPSSSVPPTFSGGAPAAASAAAPGATLAPPGGYSFGGAASPSTIPTLPGAGASAPAMATPPGGMPLSGMPITVPPASSLPPGVAPSASLQGTIQPQTPNSWDPFATPGSNPQPWMGDSVFAAPAAGAGAGAGLASPKLVERLRFDYDWIAPGSAENGFGSNDFDLAATFAIPLFSLQSPFLFTPGFGMHFWDGPLSTFPALPSADMPPSAYDAYLDIGWNPQINPQFGAELSVCVGVYSDPEAVTDDSVRVTGKGMAVFTMTPTMQLKGGVWYLDRNRVKLLPAGGLIWTPNAETRLELLFPNPKLARRLTVVGDAEWWYYIRGWYGGGNWTVQRAFGGGIDSVDYNDIRVALGLDCLRKAGMSGYFEAGVSFNRQIVYRFAPQDNVDPSTTVFLGAGMRF